MEISLASPVTMYSSSIGHDAFHDHVQLVKYLFWLIYVAFFLGILLELMYSVCII